MAETIQNETPSTTPQTIPLTVEEYQRFRSIEKQLEEIQSQQQSALEAKEAERLKVLAEKGQVEDALNEQRKSWEQKHAEAQNRFAQLEQQIQAERKNTLIAETLRGRQFVGETAEQRSAAAAMVHRLLQDDFETTRDTSGIVVVREKTTGRPAAEAIRERLESPQFALFFAAASRGGAGSDGTRGPVHPKQSQPGSLEAIVSQWKARQNAYQSFGLHPVV